MILRTMRSLRLSLLLASCATAAFGAEAASAQSAQAAAPAADETGVGDIIVTARRVKENLQNVPIAITALSSARLTESGGTTIADVGNLAPSVHVNSISPINGSSNTPNFNIRGIGTTDFLLTIDPSVGVYVDGVYVARSVGGLFDLLDLERVEILRGPQGTLFGRNTIGGAVQYVSRAPDKQFRLSGEATVGSYHRFDVRGSISGAITDTLFGSFAFSRKKQDGYGNRVDFFATHPGLTGTIIDINGRPQTVPLRQAIAAITLYDEATATLLSGNGAGLAPGSILAGGKVIAPGNGNARPGNVNNWSTRASLVWAPSDGVKFTLIGDYAKNEESSPALVIINTFETDFSKPLTGGGYAGNLVALHNAAFAPATIKYNDANFVIGDHYSTYGNGPSGSISEVFGGSLTGEFTLSPDVSIKTITAYRNLDSLFGDDADQSPLEMDSHSNSIQQNQFSQELQLLGKFGNLNGVAGAYYFTEKGNDEVIVPLVNGLAVLDENNAVKNQSFALFTQETYKFDDQNSITGGIRYTHEKKDYDQRHLDCGVANALGVPPTVIVNRCYSLSTGKASQTFNNVSYLVNYSHRFNANAMAYISYSTGFKSGGFTGRSTAYFASQTPIPFGPEKARSVELGLKTNFRGIRFNAALFNTDYSGIQLTVQQGIAPITINGADARIRGAEFEGEFRPFEGLTINASVSLLDAKYTTVRPFGIGPVLPNTPKFSSNLGLSYKLPVGTSSVTLHADGTYRSSVYSNTENTVQLIQPNFFELNASVKWSDARDRFSLTAGGRNITNESTLITGFFQPGVGYNEGVYTRPAQWYLTAAFKY